MFKNREKRSAIVAYLLVATVISLVVNFSYLLLLMVNTDDGIPPRNGIGRKSQEASVVVEGRFALSCDGFGYIITDSGDSVYVERRNTRLCGLADGDILKVEAGRQVRYPEGHLVMQHLSERNGKEFDYGSIYDSSSRFTEILYQLLFYLAVSTLLLMVMAMHNRKATWQRFAKRGALCAVITFVAYFFAPVTLRFTGETVLIFHSYHLIDYPVIMKCVFMFVTAMLYSQIYNLTNQRQQVVLENEQLKNENLTTRYNMLVSQINPHFFFNSLNSLSMLVREKDNNRALEYIDQLSYTFRYITQNGNNNNLVTLRDETDFASAYCYLFKIRYADKIFFDFEIDDKYMDCRLPALSLQPLLGNAVKHNAITNKNPFHVRIYVENGCLIVENERRPLLEERIGTGTGLKNLNSRYMLILGRGIEIEDTAERFVVRLPLMQKDEGRIES